MIELFRQPSLTEQQILDLSLPLEQKTYLNQIIKSNHILRFILSQEMWVFYEFDKKFGRISFAGKYANQAKVVSCLEEMEATVFRHVYHYPLVKSIILFKYNLRVLRSPLFLMEYENLKELTLELNKTLNIEGLQWLNTPNLQKLSIAQNRLTNIKPLTKTNWKLLSKLSLNMNLLSSGNSKYLERVSFCCHQTRGQFMLTIDAEETYFKQELKGFVHFQDLGFLAKVAGYKGGAQANINYLDKNRIQQKVLIEKLKINAIEEE